jgi:hypothetical protein
MLFASEAGTGLTIKILPEGIGEAHSHEDLSHFFQDRNLIGVYIL